MGSSDPRGHQLPGRGDLQGGRVAWGLREGQGSSGALKGSVPGLSDLPWAPGPNGVGEASGCPVWTQVVHLHHLGLVPALAIGCVAWGPGVSASASPWEQADGTLHPSRLGQYPGGGQGPRVGFQVALRGQQEPGGLRLGRGGAAQHPWPETGKARPPPWAEGSETGPLRGSQAPANPMPTGSWGAELWGGACLSLSPRPAVPPGHWPSRNGERERLHLPTPQWRLAHPIPSPSDPGAGLLWPRSFLRGAGLRRRPGCVPQPANSGLCTALPAWLGEAPPSPVLRRVPVGLAHPESLQRAGGPRGHHRGGRVRTGRV